MVTVDSKSNAIAKLMRTDCGCWADRYVGCAEDLIAAGLITADQLPGALGRNKTHCTYYDGVPVKKGASKHRRDERYFSIKRYGKKFEVIKGIPKQVEEERHAAREASEARAKNEGQIAEAAMRATADGLRDFCLRQSRMTDWALSGGDGLYPFKFSASARTKMDILLGELAALMHSSEVVPLHPEKASASKAHLRLAWSAP